MAGHGIEIEGPSRISVGQTATYRVEMGDADSWVWVLPNGRYIADEAEVSLTPRSPGSAELTLQSHDSDGRSIEVSKAIHVGE